MLAAREIPPLHVSPAPVEIDDFGAPVEQVEQVAEAAGEAEAPAFNAHRERQPAP